MSGEKSKQYDLTSGGIFHKLLVISLPVIGMQLMQMVYNLADMFWMGKLGVDALAATSGAGMYLWLSMGFMTLGRMGSEIGVSQSIGAGDRDNAHRFMTNSFLLALILGITIGSIMSFGRSELVSFFKIQETNVVQLTEKYLGISGIGLPFMFASVVIAGTFAGAGNSKLVFYINAIGITFNLILDPVLIFVLDMGIAGAAVSNIIGQISGCILSLFALHFHHARPFPKVKLLDRFHAETLRQIFRWSLPILLQEILFPFLSMLITRLLTQWGAAVIAAQRVGSQAESLTWLVAGGFCMAVTSFIGQNFGAKKWDRIYKGLRISAFMLTVYGLAVSLFLYFGGIFIFQIFTDDAEVLRQGAEYLRILAWCQIACCFESLFAGYFRGIGKTLPPSITSISCNALRVVAALFLSQTSLGANGIYWSISIGSAARGMILLVWFFIHLRKSSQLHQSIQ